MLRGAVPGLTEVNDVAAKTMVSGQADDLWAGPDTNAAVHGAENVGCEGDRNCAFRFTRSLNLLPNANERTNFANKSERPTVLAPRLFRLQKHQYIETKEKIEFCKTLTKCSHLQIRHPLGAQPPAKITDVW
jgi:hypothetical protein